MEKFYLFKGLPFLSNETFIVSSKAPFYIGRILFFDDDMKWAEYTNNSNKSLAFAQVYPYRILVEVSKSLSGLVYASPTIIRQMKKLSMEMAKFYFEQEIRNNVIKFEKYRF